MKYKNVTEYYFFTWTKLWDCYLTDVKVRYSKSDINIICVKLDPVNHEAEFKALLEGYDKWLEDNKYDRSLFPNANGSMYHRQ